MSFSLRPFQVRAANQIAARYRLLTEDPRRPLEHAGWPTPYYQALSALTGSGKTPILADAVAQLRTQFGAEPVVLWVAKSRAVVEQTHANFSPGGKYESLVEGFLVTTLGELTPERVRDDTQAVVAFATVGSFNRDQASRGDLRVHRGSEGDLWRLLAERPGLVSGRRPLVVVYDEGHNLSDQQTELLFELEPNVILVASATMKTPGKLGRTISRLRDAGWEDQPAHAQDREDDAGRDERPEERRLVTAVRSKYPVAEGLIKRQLVLGGYATQMETALADMLDEFRRTDAKARDLQAGFRPKAIYVCKTNVNIDDGGTDAPGRPFRERRAPPILIWRYLVEQAGIAPDEIAVYCDLKVDRRHNAPPIDFHLFSGGEDDFEAFTVGNFRHVIFNLSLQEGWDDPACCFAYIDKSMGSAQQIEQVIGRVLRQPGGRHHADPDLNTANFYIRVDGAQEFPAILQTVKARIAADMPAVRLEGFSDGRDRRRARFDPRESRTVPHIHLYADAALGPIDEVLADIHDYTGDDRFTSGPGELTRARQRLGDGSAPDIETRATEHSNRVLARWVVRRTIAALYPEVVKGIEFLDPKFDARVDVTSAAARRLRDDAERLVDTYLAHAELAFEDTNPYAVASVLANPERYERFTHALHEGYSDLNGTELLLARAIDATGLPWVRNPANGGYNIPLLEKGDTRAFFPDFLVWKDDRIFALDPKGGQLLARDAGRKLLAIRDEKGRQRVVVRFITEGKWNYETLKPAGPSVGYSVWRLATTGQLRCTYHKDAESAVAKCLVV